MSAGVDVVAHVPADAELDKALVERMAEAGIVVGPLTAGDDIIETCPPQPSKARVHRHGAGLGPGPLEALAAGRVRYGSAWIISTSRPTEVQVGP